MPTSSRTAAQTANSDLTRAADVTPDERLAAAFGKHVGRWARAQGASAAVAALAQRAATSVSQATADGHSCLGLSELADSLNTEGPVTRSVAAVRELLIESKVVGVPAAPDSLPLILDDERLYLHRYFDYECRLANSLAARSASRLGAITEHLPAPPVLSLLDRLFAADSPGRGSPGRDSPGRDSPGRGSPERDAPAPPSDAPASPSDAPALASDAPDWQKIAAITALLGRVTIISGGPGTGKTTTVVNLLACLLEADPDCRIALTAPTGKAAARLTEVILQRAGHLPEALRAKLPTQSSTIHRLLGVTPDGEFRHDADHRLPIDVLVVDEASMLDLALAVHLIEAVPENARIILLGDKDQLAAVESGAVFAELSAHPTFSVQRIETLSRLSGVAPQMLVSPQKRVAPQAGHAPALDPSPQQGPQTSLQDSVIWLRRNYRFAAGSGIGLLAAQIKDGNASRVLERLQDSSDPSLVWINDGGSVPSAASIQAIVDGYAQYLEAVLKGAASPRAISAAFARFRVLCAVREGPWGVNAINSQVETHFRRALQHAGGPGLRGEWYPGRPVMVLRNDHVLKLFNGDIGIVLPDKQGVLQVYFPDETGDLRAIAPVRLPDHETAFAMTVHKSQGSEFEELLLVLPAEKNRVLSRELFYTAVTRARERLAIVANATVIAGTVETATKRVSGLLSRMR